MKIIKSILILILIFNIVIVYSQDKDIKDLTKNDLLQLLIQEKQDKIKIYEDYQDLIILHKNTIKTNDILLIDIKSKNDEIIRLNECIKQKNNDYINLLNENKNYINDIKNIKLELIDKNNKIISLSNIIKDKNNKILKKDKYIKELLLTVIKKEKIPFILLNGYLGYEYSLFSSSTNYMIASDIKFNIYEDVFVFGNINFYSKYNFTENNLFVGGGLGYRFSFK